MKWIILFTVIYTLKLILKLNWMVAAVLFVGGICLWPLHQKRIRKQRENETRFYDAALYLDILLYAFLKEEKVEAALRDTIQTLPEGQMKSVTQEAWHLMQMDYDDVNLMEEAFGKIEKEFSCKRIRDVHKFMTHVEYYGGEIAHAVSLLLEDKRRWEKRIRRAMEERKKKWTEIVLSVLVSILICGIILYLPILNVDISNHIMIQICSVIVLFADELIILRAQRFLMVDWLNLNLLEEEEYSCKKMQEYHHYNERKEKRVSNLLGSIVFFVAVILFILGMQWQCVLALGLSIFFYFQHKIGRRLLYQKLTREIKYAFPNWLLDMVLLLQSENVHMALQKSREYVPAILKDELATLVERLDMEPESSKPYHLFLADFSLPEVHSAMSGLYAISIGNSFHDDRQMGELIEKNMEMLDREETKRLSDAAGMMYLLFLAPVLVASFKLVVDMAFLMILFIQTPML